MLNDDYREILQILIKSRVRFLVIGAYAMAIYGHPRSTGDFDIWVEPSKRNSEKIYQSLKKFGAPVSDMRQDTFCEKGIVFQIGVSPRRVDIITDIDGVDFNKAYKNKKVAKVSGIKLPFISKEDIIKNKESTGRDKDMLDLKYLKGKQKR